MVLTSIENQSRRMVDETSLQPMWQHECVNSADDKGCDGKPVHCLALNTQAPAARFTARDGLHGYRGPYGRGTGQGGAFFVGVQGYGSN